MQATGVVRRAALPAMGQARAGGADDLDLAAEVDRRVRGAAHGPDLDVLLRAGARLLVLDDRQERGYVALHNVGCSWGPKCAGAPVRDRRRLDAGGGA
ncbi:hypothetical protein ABT297_41510 [Dactylosporangium sp. NPDC000555]|uniref:hypothetical protein n=1 Tax=Dactylosporangium sp. NPDC000555 TaxID=3154260 RepID=UPI0033170DBA